MRVDEYAQQDATGLARLVREGTVTCAEVAEAFDTALGEVEPQLNAVVVGPFEALPANVDGPLAGVQTVLKDLGAHSATVPLRSGTRLSGEGVRFTEDSTLVSRFKDAGLAIRATTTVPEFGLNFNSEALATGSTRNPWNLAHSAGGSSGGSAALVAAGVVPVAHANDGGGSIRVPAAYNHLVGLKPSRGRVPVGPDRAELLFGVATEGAVTRTVRDAALLLDVMAGPAAGDKYLVSSPDQTYVATLHDSPGVLRVAIDTSSWSGHPVSPALVRAVDQVAARLIEFGHHVEILNVDLDYDRLIEANVPLYAALTADSVDAISGDTGLNPSGDTLELTTLAFYERGMSMNAADLIWAFGEVNHFSRFTGTLFDSWDLLVTPTSNTPAPRLGYHDANAALSPEEWMRRLFDVCSFTFLFNVSGNPAISVPAGIDQSGLPLGVQLVAPMGREDRLLQIAASLEQSGAWEALVPRVHASTVDR